jgi:LmbE family N-acetylglucosaminyl deacetylase
MAAPGSDARVDMLAVFAHPDDEVLCAAGTMALCARAGARVALVCATRGELGPISDPALADHENLPEVRERELRASCAALGVDDVTLLGLPDAGVDWSAEEAGTVEQLAELIRSRQPRVIITFGDDGLYGHSDHVAIGELTTRARAQALAAEGGKATGTRTRDPRLFYAVITGESVANLLRGAAQAGLPATLWTLGPEHFHRTSSDVTARVDVSSVLANKLTALRCHRTQLEPDNVLAHLTPELARGFFGTESFRCADRLAGDPHTLACIER